MGARFPAASGETAGGNDAPMQYDPRGRRRNRTRSQSVAGVGSNSSHDREVRKFSVISFSVNSFSVISFSVISFSVISFSVISGEAGSRCVPKADDFRHSVGV
ncbi:MAG: hypothetical protein ABI759_17830 [Candidatus Solibacter sp.]